MKVKTELASPGVSGGRRRRLQSHDRWVELILHCCAGATGTLIWSKWDTFIPANTKVFDKHQKRKLPSLANTYCLYVVTMNYCTHQFSKSCVPYQPVKHLRHDLTLPTTSLLIIKICDEGRKDIFYPYKTSFPLLISKFVVMKLCRATEKEYQIKPLIFWPFLKMKIDFKSTIVIQCWQGQHYFFTHPLCILMLLCFVRLCILHCTQGIIKSVYTPPG